MNEITMRLSYEHVDFLIGVSGVDVCGKLFDHRTDFFDNLRNIQMGIWNIIECTLPDPDTGSL